MAEEDTPQEEKTEEPTARRLENGRRSGASITGHDNCCCTSISSSQHFVRVDFGWARDLGTCLPGH